MFCQAIGRRKKREWEVLRVSPLHPFSHVPLAESNYVTSAIPLPSKAFCTRKMQCINRVYNYVVVIPKWHHRSGVELSVSLKPISRLHAIL